MTEEQAKTKWCPFVRLTASQGEWHTSRDPSLPSAPDDTQAYRCIASACMAWRSRHPENGYCGLAGNLS